MATWSRTSFTSSGDTPVLRVARTCSFSSSCWPSAASIAMVSMLRVLRSSPGRLQTRPQAVSVTSFWKSSLNGVAVRKADST